MGYSDPEKQKACVNRWRRDKRKIDKEAKIASGVLKKDRQYEVAVLFYKGSSLVDIIGQTGYPEKEVKFHLRKIRESLTPKTRGALIYRTNLVKSKISMIEKAGWAIHDRNVGKSIGGREGEGDKLALTALGKLNTTAELLAKVEGVTQERLIVGPEKEASKLLSDVLSLEKKAEAVREENKVKEDDLEKVTPIPRFLEEMSDA